MNAARSLAVVPLIRIGGIAKVVRRIIGVPDYDAYVAHQRSCHPDEEPITREAFAREALARRYERPGSRCC
jgi:uncharacterized short protein YbdD (DUF466 family)